MSSEFHWCKPHRILYRTAEPGRHGACDPTVVPPPPRPVRKGRRKKSTKVTDRQWRVVDSIRSAIEAKGYPPTLKEISAVVGIGPQAVAYQLRQLEEKGLLRREPGLPRSLVLLPTAPITDQP